MILVDDGRDTGGERTKFKILNFLFKNYCIAEIIMYNNIVSNTILKV